MPTPAPSNPTWRLRPHVHAAQVDDDIVFLDVAADAYLCLPDVGDRLVLDPDRWRATVCDTDLRTELAAAGLIGPDERAAPPPRMTPPPPARSALRLTYPPPRAGDVIDGLRALNDLARRYRGRSFADILERATGAGRASELADAGLSGLIEAIDRFHRWVPYAPVSGKCLLRAFMLRRHLQRSGFATTWVFGVTTWPFKAHCWLQHGDMVLDDAADLVATFTPILAL